MRLKEEMRREKEVARLKAANVRATARRIAKESTELIEDERLELMELAASKKGVPSTLSLDSEILQNLEAFRGSSHNIYLTCSRSLFLYIDQKFTCYFLKINLGKQPLEEMQGKGAYKRPMWFCLSLDPRHSLVHLLPFICC